MTTITTLNDGDRIYLETWTGIYSDSSVTVGTVVGYALQNGRDPIAAVARALSNNHPLAYTMADNSCLYGCKHEGARAKAQREQWRAQAIAVENGQHVMIDEEEYIVFVVCGNEKRPYHSDPIRFIPA